MLLFFFLLLIFTVGGLVWFKFHYKKLLKYFMEDAKTTSLEAILIESLERSVFPLLFGCAHALLIDHLLLQSIVLGVIEVSYFCSRVYALRSMVVKYRFKVVMLSISSLLRMVFISTFYLF